MSHALNFCRVCRQANLVSGCSIHFFARVWEPDLNTSSRFFFWAKFHNGHLRFSLIDSIFTENVIQITNCATQFDISRGSLKVQQVLSNEESENLIRNVCVC